MARSTRSKSQRAVGGLITELALRRSFGTHERSEAGHGHIGTNAGSWQGVASGALRYGRDVGRRASGSGSLATTCDRSHEHGFGLVEWSPLLRNPPRLRPGRGRAL